MSEDVLDQQRRNQAAFDDALPELLAEHPGRVAVFQAEELFEIYDTYADAYTDALREFGTDEVFLVSEILKRGPEPVSLSLDLGLLAGEV